MVSVLQGSQVVDGGGRRPRKGTMATIGRSAAVAQLPLGVKLTGRVAWLAWPGRLNVIVGDPP